ncbi:MAG: beta-L-arabinofuranosidase domain-containing protein [Steroidobacteraceae bacterium]
MTLSRRHLLQAAASAAAWIAASARGIASRAGELQPSLSPFPLEAIRLRPSQYLTAVDSNRAYLLSLEPDRLLHNYRKNAGLEPKAAIYGGWENDTIAGHTLGHYLSALSLLHAQTGDTEAPRRVTYIVSELAECQAKSRDGFVAGFTRRRGDVIENGRLAMEEVRRGDIHARPFDLNGAWSPFYNWHKVMAGLLDADRFCGEQAAIDVASRLGGYIEGLFAGLSEPQVQQVLLCEYGGLNESFAELHARTGQARWLIMARKLYDRSVLQPLVEGRDELAHLHANTQVPKLIGLQRLYELTGEQDYGRAAGVFWDLVTSRYSYVIGGNADREDFQAPLSISKHITEQTCESCNSYNMLKLTRQLYAMRPSSAYGDENCRCEPDINGTM